MDFAPPVWGADVYVSAKPRAIGLRLVSAESRSLGVELELPRENDPDAVTGLDHSRARLLADKLSIPARCPREDQIRRHSTSRIHAEPMAWDPLSQIFAWER